MPPLDGLRGLAILLVMLYHYNVELNHTNFLQRLAGSIFGFGWSGVDLFFVLSGFLITGILLDTRESPNCLSAFYMRRVLRIFPLYYLSLIVVFLLVPAIFAQDVMILPAAEFRKAYLVYVQNWLGGFHPPGQGIVGHYWSLAIEEQFYLVWPLVIVFLAPRRLPWIIGATCLFTIGWRITLLHLGAEPEAIYRNTTTRIDALLMGAACALIVRNGRAVAAIRPYAGWLCLAPVVVLGVLRVISRPFSNIAPLVVGGGYTAIGLGYAALLLAAVLTMGSGAVLQRFLTWRPLMVAGKYSYGAYIWHLLVADLVTMGLRATRINLPGPIHVVLAILATVGVSIGSYYLLERHFLLLKRHFESRRELR
jgi:peptidoglycan/LPS O-acetylase OafA/YrhL